jgi:hypothetical protein
MEADNSQSLLEWLQNFDVDAADRIAAISVSGDTAHY